MLLTQASPPASGSFNDRLFLCSYEDASSEFFTFFSQKTYFTVAPFRIHISNRRCEESKTQTCDPFSVTLIITFNGRKVLLIFSQLPTLTDAVWDGVSPLIP